MNPDLIKKNKGSNRHCTLPAIFGLRDWFHNRFNDLCEAHDFMYIHRLGKWRADKIMLAGMYDRGYWWVVPPTFVFFMTVGFAYYYLVD